MIIKCQVKLTTNKQTFKYKINVLFENVFCITHYIESNHCPVNYISNKSWLKNALGILAFLI